MKVGGLASGLPVVASRVGGIPEILKHGGGLLVPPNNPESLASALEYLILDKSARQRTALDALQSFRKHFTWQVVRSQYRHVLEDVSARQPAVQQREIAAST